ncbi:HAD family hydrolase [Parafrankia elaeagni]|uniref:HAD family hydrolase n=1 Tax=Parafrankia elaeagni TaxID=222534 RepID=UPI00035C8211|nr:HAD family hydrolase [Parafrankia elaeagni]
MTERDTTAIIGGAAAAGPGPGSDLGPGTSPAPLAGLVVVFDWNGTIMDDAERARAATATVLRRRGRPGLTADEFAAAFRLPLSEFMHGLGITPADAAQAEREWNAHLAAHPAPARPHAADALDALRRHGARLGVLSAASADPVRTDLVAAGLADRFDFVETAVADKPGRLSAHRRGHPLGVYVGDTAYDIRSGHRAGCLAIGVSGGYQRAGALLTAGADALVSDLADLPGVIRDLVNRDGLHSPDTSRAEPSGSPP